MVFAAVATWMFVYQSARHSILADVSEQAAQFITIGLVAAMAAATANLAMRRQGVVERRLAETHAREAALEESETRYRQLVEASPEAIAVHRDGVLLYVYTAAHRLVGVEDGAMLANRTALDFVHADDLPYLLVPPAEHLEGKLRQFRLVRRDGAIVEVEASSVRMTFAGQPAVQTVFRDVSDRKRLEAELLHQAFHDALTGLANRALFRDRVEQALARAARDGDRRLAVLFLDLDDFKSVNDTLGHAAGDRLLVSVAERLLRATRGIDTVARLGGDEFAVLLDELQNPGDEMVVVDRIGAFLGRPLVIDEREVSVTASIGIAHASAGDDTESVLRNADVAMYQAKGAGKARHAVFEPAMFEAVVARIELEADLRRAVDAPEAHGFSVAYQPIMDLATGAFESVEALLRWTHPTRGAVPPATIIPVAEETGLIVPLGLWVLQESCRQLAAWAEQWRADGSSEESLPAMAVNISGRQLELPEFVDMVAGVLRETGAPAHKLTLEITESTLMQRTEDTLATLHGLKALGLRLAIDDFGTGYSSLAYLQKFPIDVLKIDRSFVGGMSRGGSEAALARTIIALGELLHVRTVAEGIESPAQREQLKALGCSHGQGFLFARPLPPEAVTKLLSGYRRSAAVA
jgi:diguanylate cyclase (GGDEF)-like protein/PAS domain S-box-containing protein